MLKFIPVFVLALLVLISGCVTDGDTSAKGNSTRGTPTQSHLITPESTEDLTRVTDANLDKRIAEKRKAINQLMGKTFVYKLDHSESDLSSDVKFQALLRQTKQSETDLLVLERETARRAAASVKD